MGGGLIEQKAFLPGLLFLLVYQLWLWIERQPKVEKEEKQKKIINHMFSHQAIRSRPVHKLRMGFLVIRRSWSWWLMKVRAKANACRMWWSQIKTKTVRVRVFCSDCYLVIWNKQKVPKTQTNNYFQTSRLCQKKSTTMVRYLPRHRISTWQFAQIRWLRWPNMPPGCQVCCYFFISNIQSCCCFK